MKKVHFGLVVSFQSPDMQKLYSILQGMGRVSFVGPDDRDTRYDAIIVPSAGISPNLACFAHDTMQHLPFAPICPFIERFREQSIPYYRDKDISIIGLGDSAAIVWDLLKQKVVSTSLGLRLLTPKDNKDITLLGKNDIFVDAFSLYQDETSILAGFVEIGTQFSNCVLDIRNNIMKEAGRLKDANTDNAPEEDVIELI